MFALPSAMAVTVPEASTVATLLFDEAHTPAKVASESDVVVVAQIVSVPTIGATVGRGLTVNTKLAALSQPAALVRCAMYVPAAL